MRWAHNLNQGEAYRRKAQGWYPQPGGAAEIPTRTGDGEKFTIVVGYPVVNNRGWF